MVTKKKILFTLLFVLAFALMISSANFFASQKIAYASEIDTWNGSADLTASNDSFAQTGSQDDPYLIENAQQFVLLSQIVQDTTLAGKYNTSSKFYKLTIDLDLNSYNFQGIGVEGYEFKANFDGDNHTIKNFKHSSPTSYGPTTFYCGLFNLTSGATIKNLVLDNPTMSLTLLARNTSAEMGFVCGKATSSTIENITITSPTINIKGGSKLELINLGGIVGRIYGEGSNVNNCVVSNLGAVFSGKSDDLSTYCGGIAGTAEQDATIKNCYIDNSNSVSITQTGSSSYNHVGGIVGAMYTLSDLENCFSKLDTITPNFSDSATNYFGGLVGYLKESSVSNCYAFNNLWTEDTTSTNYFGGIVGYSLAGDNMFKTSDAVQFLNSCYFVLTGNPSFSYANAGALIGYLQTTSDINQNTITITNAYYSFQNSSASLQDYNSSSAKYSSDTQVVANQLDSTSAKSLSNYQGFSAYIWSDDTENINSGYPILNGVGNDVVPNMKLTYEILIYKKTVDQNGTSENVLLQTLNMEQESSETFNVEQLENYSIDIALSNSSVAIAYNEKTGILTISNPTATAKIYITYTKNSYIVTLNVANNVGGTIEFASGYSQYVYHGQNCQITISPDATYIFDKSTGCEISGTYASKTIGDTNLILSNIKSNISITITFTKTYTIVVKTNDAIAGLVSIDNSNWVEEQTVTIKDGETLKAYAKLNDDQDGKKYFYEWKINGESLVTDSSVTLGYIKQDYVLEAFWAVTDYQVQVAITESVSHDDNKVKLNNTQVVNGQTITAKYNDNYTITFQNNDMSYIMSAKVGTTTLSAEQIENGYQFVVTSNISIVVEFAEYISGQIYAYSNNFENETSYQNIDAGNYVGFEQNPTTILANKKLTSTSISMYAISSEKYTFNGWFSSTSFIDENLLSTSAQYTFNFSENFICYAKFTLKTYTVTIQQKLIDENGETTTKITDISVEHQSNLSQVISVPENYNYQEVLSNCNATFNLSTSTVYAQNITGVQNIVVVFEKQNYAVSISVANNIGGTAEFANGYSQKVYHGQNSGIVITAADTYIFDNINGYQIVGNFESVDAQTSIILIQNITSDISLTITFTKTYQVNVTAKDSDGNIATFANVSFDNISYTNSLNKIYVQGSALNIYQQIDTEYQNTYEFKRWINTDGSVYSTDAQIVISNLNFDINISAVYAKIGYSVSFEIEQEVTKENNKVLLDSTLITNNYVKDGIDYETKFVLSFSHDAGSYVQSVSINNQPLSASQLSTGSADLIVTQNTQVKIVFVAYKFDITLSAQNGTLKFDDRSTSKQVSSYDQANVVATPNEGYTYLASSTSMANIIVSEVVDSTGSANITLANFVSNGDAVTNITVQSTFKLLTFDVVVDFDSNGDVSINGQEVVSQQTYTFDYGTALTFAFEPKSEYYLNSVYLNLQDITQNLSNNQYTVDKLTENLSLTASFGVLKYKFKFTNDFDVDFDVKVNGQTPTTEYFDSGSEVQISILLPQGYRFAGYYLSDKTTLIQEESTYNFTLLQDTEIYGKLLAKVEIVITQHGHVSANDKSSDFFEYNTPITLQITPSIGYKFNGFAENISFDQNNTFNLTAPVTLTPMFVSKDVLVTISSSQFGKVSGSVSGTYHIGDVLHLNATATANGYVFDSYTGTFAGELENVATTTYTILTQDAENGVVAITANFTTAKFEVFVTANHFGSVSHIGRETYDYGQVLEIEISPYSMYYIQSLIVDGENKTNDLTNSGYQHVVTKNSTIEIIFAPVLWIDYAVQPEGYGTTANPYIITNVRELAFIAYSINFWATADSDKASYASAYYILANDIDCSGAFFTPIGTEENPFNGTFDYNFFKITNIQVVDDISLYKYDGLFDVIGPNGRIINRYKTDYTPIIIVGAIVLTACLIVVVILIEKRRRKPKKVVVLPRHLPENIQTNNAPKINRPDLTKLNKK